jgi:YVTN family beta-propeller protein
MQGAVGERRRGCWPRRTLWAMLVLLAAASARPAAAAPFAYVANIDSNTVSVIDTATNKVVGPPIELGIGTGPVAVAVTPDGTHAYVANSGTGTVSVIDTATDTVLTGPGFPIPVGTGPDGVAVTRTGHRFM